MLSTSPRTTALLSALRVVSLIGFVLSIVLVFTTQLSWMPWVVLFFALCGFIVGAVRGVLVIAGLIRGLRDPATRKSSVLRLVGGAILVSALLAVGIVFLRAAFAFFIELMKGLASLH